MLTKIENRFKYIKSKYKSLAEPLRNSVSYIPSSRVKDPLSFVNFYQQMSTFIASFNGIISTARALLG